MIDESTVELLYFTGCPHVSAARANLLAAFQALGRTPRWKEWDLEDPHVPDRLSGYASPTVLVAGYDVLGGAPEPGEGLRCAADGAPPVSRIVQALSAHD